MFKTLKSKIRPKQGIFYLCVFSVDFLLTNAAGKFKWENNFSTKICQKTLYFELTLVFLECYAQIGGTKTFDCEEFLKVLIM
jgi:hypothetical protein